jgi:L-alanine-DL-glutamate epimerase-like enolase superfamily enzyme
MARIARIEIVPYSVPIKRFADAYTSFTASSAVLVRLESDEGVVGFGEACAWEPEFYGETVESIASTLEKYVAPKLLGQDPLQLQYVLSVVDACLARVTCVKEGVDLALHDLVGKLLGVPVYVLLGGAFRDRIRVASEIGIASPEEMANEATRVRDLGFRVLKVKGSADVEKDIVRVQAVREAVGPSIGLRLDPNAAWTPIGTIRAMRQLEHCELELLEQPVPGNDYAGMAHIRRKTSVPLMADEGVWTPDDVLRIRRVGAADVVNIKIAKSCGLARGKHIQIVADAAGLSSLVGTEIEPGFSIAAKLHLAASFSRHDLASEFTELSLLKRNVLSWDPEIVDGELQVPQAPGLGVGLDQDEFDACRLR